MLSDNSFEMSCHMMRPSPNVFNLFMPASKLGQISKVDKTLPKFEWSVIDLQFSAVLLVWVQ